MHYSLKLELLSKMGSIYLLSILYPLYISSNEGEFCSTHNEAITDSKWILFVGLSKTFIKNIFY